MKPKDNLSLQEAREIRRNFRMIALGVLAVLAIGVIFYHFVEGLSWLNATYFCVVTLTTVGYGDIAPKTDPGKIFTIFYLLIGIGIIAAFLNNLLRSTIARRKIKESEKSGKP